MPTFIQPSLSRGELTPDAFARVDTAAYRVALATARNVVVNTWGGVSNRSGSRIILPAKHPDYRVRFIPFSFKATDNYAIIFGEFYIWFLRDDGIVLESNFDINVITNSTGCQINTTAPHEYATGDFVFLGEVPDVPDLSYRFFTVEVLSASALLLRDIVLGTPIDSTNYGVYQGSGAKVARIYELPTVWNRDDIWKLGYSQTADVLTLTMRGKNIYDLKRFGNTFWTLETPTFEPSAKAPIGITFTPNSAGTTTYSYVVTAFDKDTGEESLPGLGALSRDITAATQTDPVAIDISPDNWDFEAGDQIYITGVVGMTELNEKRFIIDGPTGSTTWTLRDTDGTNFSAYVSGGTVIPAFMRGVGNDTPDNTVNWELSANASRYAVYRFQSGAYGLLGETTRLYFDDDAGVPDLSIAPPQQRNPFPPEELDSQPGASGFFQQRRVFGGSTNDPDTSWYTRTGSINSFALSVPGQDDDAITATLAAGEIDEIRHYVPLSDLLVFTSGREWEVTSGGEAAFAATTITQSPQTNWGASFLKPIVVGATVVFADPSNTRLRSIGYSLELDGYTGSNITLTAAHLFRSDTITDMTYSATPESRIFMSRSGGGAATLTIDQEQEVLGWTRWDTYGSFESFGAVPKSVPAIEEWVYTCVRRVLRGVEARYIELFAPRDISDVRDGCFLDCSVTYDAPFNVLSVTLFDPIVVGVDRVHGFPDGQRVDFQDLYWLPSPGEDGTEQQPDQLQAAIYTVEQAGTVSNFRVYEVDGVTPVNGSGWVPWIRNGQVRAHVTTVYGLWHLEGETVTALADGHVVTDLVVTDGKITLPFPAGRVHVGLKYVSDVETLSPEPPNSTIQGKTVKIPRVTIRYKDTRDILVGPSFDDLTATTWRTDELTGEATRLYTGDKRIDMPPHWNADGHVAIRQDLPLPMTILGIIPDIEIED